MKCPNCGSENVKGFPIWVEGKAEPVQIDYQCQDCPTEFMTHPKQTETKGTTFGEYFSHFRHSTSLTQRQLADVLEVHYTYISKIENNKLEVLPSDELLANAEKAMFLDAGTLFELSGKLNIKALQDIAQSNPIACKVLRRIASESISDAQWKAIIELLGSH